MDFVLNWSWRGKLSRNGNWRSMGRMALTVSLLYLGLLVGCDKSESPGETNALHTALGTYSLNTPAGPNRTTATKAKAIELINLGMDVNSVDEFGCTPLALATEKDFGDIVILLLSKGAKKSFQNPYVSFTQRSCLST